MKILKEGNLSRLSTVRVFECPDCGCLWEASGCEYARTVVTGRRMIECNCPTCKRLVSIDDD